MKKLQLFALALAALLALPLVLGLVKDARGNAEEARATEQGLERKAVTPRGNFELADAKAFKGFPIYTVGDTFRNLPLNAAIRVNASRIPGEAVRADHVTFMYGGCESVGGQGCMVPLQVQVWNACERNRDSYATGPGPPAVTSDESLKVRGVDAAYFEDFSRLELYSGAGTIVLFADGPNRELLLDAAKALRGYNVHAPAAVPLPALGKDSKPIGCEG
jgi:hypothetical protein